MQYCTIFPFSEGEVYSDFDLTTACPTILLAVVDKSSICIIGEPYNYHPLFKNSVTLSQNSLLSGPVKSLYSIIFFIYSTPVNLVLKMN